VAVLAHRPARMRDTRVRVRLSLAAIPDMFGGGVGYWAEHLSAPEPEPRPPAQPVESLETLKARRDEVSAARAELNALGFSKLAYDLYLEKHNRLDHDIRIRGG
jgi:hypothetical protein